MDIIIVLSMLWSATKFIFRHMGIFIAVTGTLAAFLSPEVSTLMCIPYIIGGAALEVGIYFGLKKLSEIMNIGKNR